MASGSTNRDDGDDPDGSGEQQHRGEQSEHEAANEQRAKLVLSPGQLTRSIELVLFELHHRDCPIYIHEDALVFVSSTRSSHDQGGPQIVPASPELLGLLLSLTFVFVQQTRNGEVIVDPPAKLVRAILKLPTWPFRRLRRLVNVPVLLPDGRVLVEPGLDVDTGIYLSIDTAAALPPIPVVPSFLDAQAAYAVLEDVLVDCLFADSASRAAAVAALITPVLRSAIDGCVPAFVVDAAVPRIGKTELVQFCSLLATGEAVTVQPPAGNTETEKRITSHVAAGHRIVAFDNGTEPIGGRAMEAAITARKWTGRRLGSSTMIAGQMDITFYFTGNNSSYDADMLGRVVVVRLATDLEFPGTRPLLREDGKAWILKHRGRLIAAALTLCRAYMVAGSPNLGLVPMRGFDEWSQVVRSPIAWVGGIDPLEAMKVIRQDGDGHTEALGVGLDALSHFYPDCRHFTAKAVVVLVANPGARGADADKAIELEDALQTLIGSRPRHMTLLRFGRELKKLSGRTVGGLQLEAMGKGNAGREFRVRCIADEPSSSTRPSSVRRLPYATG